MIGRHRMDIGIASALLIVTVAVAVISIALGSRYVYVGLFGALVAGAYIRFRNHEGPRFSPMSSKRAWLVGSTVFCVLLTVSVLTLRSTVDVNRRSLTHFVSSSLLFAMVSVEAVLLPKGRAPERAILAQATVGSFWVRFAPQLLFPGVIGIDSWFHAGIVRELQLSGFVPAYSIYHGLPNFHLLAVMFGFVGGSQDLRFLELLGPIVGAAGCLFVYLIGRWLGGGQAGLLGAAFYGLSGYVVAMDFSFLAFALGATLLLAGVYQCLKYIDSRSVTSLVPVAIVMLALIGTHTVMAFTFLVMLTVLFIGRWSAPLLLFQIRPRSKRYPGSLPVFFGVALFSWWAYVSGSLLDVANLLRWGFGFEPWSPTPSSSPYLGQVPDIEYLLNLTVFFGPLALAFLGTMPLLTKLLHSESRIGFLAAVWTLAAVGLTSAVPQLIGFLGLRWNLAFQLFSGPLAGLGLIWVARLPKRKLSVALLVTIIVTPIAFISIVSPAGNMDTNVFSPNSLVRLSLTEAEQRALSHLASMHPQTVYALYPDYSYFNYYAHVNTLDLGPFLATNSTNEIPIGLVVVHSSVATSPLYYQQTIVTLKFDPIARLAASYSRVYDSGPVLAFDVGASP